MDTGYKVYDVMERKVHTADSRLTVSEVAKMMSDKFVSDTSYATPIWSGIAGFYGRYPRIPYGRPTAYVQHNRKKFEKYLFYLLLQRW